jgi:S1-C subfamily serine protease
VSGITFSRALLVVAFPAIGLILACGGGDKPDPVPTQRVELNAGQILEKDKTSVVSIETTSYYGEGGGTGIVFEDATHVLTNAHVVVGAGSIKVVDPADSSKTFAAKVVGMSPCDDVALLSIERAAGLKPATFGDSTEVKAGDRVVALGFPGTLSTGPALPIVTEGTISRLRAEFEFSGQSDLIQNTAPINPGNSGGPLYNKYGEIIGLNSYSARGAQSENYAISSNEALAVAKQLKTGKHLDYIGIGVQPNYEDFAYDNDLAYLDGLVVMGVDPGSAADVAAPNPLKPGFLIFDVNDTPVYDVGDFCDILRSQSSGATLRIRFGAYDSNDKPYNNFLTNVKVP